MKTLSRNSIVYIWAYLLSDHRPFETDICTLFWRSVVLTPAKLLIVGGFVSLLLAGGIYDWTEVALAFAVLAGAIVFTMLGVGGAITAGDLYEDLKSRSKYCTRYEVKG